MTRCFTLGLLAAFCLVPALARAQSDVPYVLSERLGSTIDAEERAYFGLFPDVEGFTEARTYAEGDSVRVEIAASPADSVATMPRATAEALGRFVETFEQHPAAFRNPDWQVLRPYLRADVPVPYAGEAEHITVFADGGRYVSQLTYTSDSLVLLNDRGHRFDWRTFEGEGIALYPHEVERVLLVPEWLGRPYFVLVGAPIGIGLNEVLMSLNPNESGNELEQRIFAGALGVVAAKAFSILYASTQSYRQAREELEAAAWFTPERRPLEMPAEATLREQVEERPEPAPVWQETYGWLSLGSGGVSFSSNSQTYDFFTGFEPDADPERSVRYESNGALLEAAAALQPFAWFDMGAGVYMGTTQTIGGTDLQEVAQSQPFLRLFADLDVIRLIDPNSRVGLSVGGGLLRSQSRVAFHAPPVTGQSGTTFYYEPDGYVLEETAFGPFYQAMLSVGLARETSAYLSLLAFTPPSVDVPLFEATSPQISTGATVYRVEPHPVSFDHLGLSAGVRLGF